MRTVATHDFQHRTLPAANFYTDLWQNSNNTVWLCSDRCVVGNAACVRNEGPLQLPFETARPRLPHLAGAGGICLLVVQAIGSTLLGTRLPTYLAILESWSAANIATP